MATIDRATPTPRGGGSGNGKWKNRFGIGRRGNKKGIVILAANNNNNNNNNGAGAGAGGSSSVPTMTTPKEMDNGEARRLSLGKRTQRLTNNNNNNTKGTIIRSGNNHKPLQVHTGGIKKESRDASDTSPSNPQSPYSNDSCLTVESDLEEKKVDHTVITDPRILKQMEERRKDEMIFQKQRMKERDGFCRRVDAYDGNVLVVDQKPTYEIGNYLGGGVAGVVYQGHRLRPLCEYPARSGVNDDETDENNDNGANNNTKTDDDGDDGVAFYCGPVNFDGAAENAFCGDQDDAEHEDETVTSPMSVVVEKTRISPSNGGGGGVFQEAADVAIEATMTQNENVVMLDNQDAPSRSKHFSRAAGVMVHHRASSRSKTGRNESSKNLNHGLSDEAVAVKILNPVGYRILQSDGLDGSVVIRRGEPMTLDVKKGLKPMTEKHVWWMVNPNSRNLRTLQRYNGKDKNSNSKSVQVDRGSEEKGLRLSLIAAYRDPRTNQLRELTLTRCIEIWGHIPFNATDFEFEDMLTAIERVNAGHAPLPIRAYQASLAVEGAGRVGPGRVGTDVSGASNSVASKDPLSPIALEAVRTGLLRAALTPRATVFCEELNAYIAIPAVPTKYLRWLRQRRAATKEVRNMMLIGRHKNVLHLFEVLEYIEESKSTMFLILELVKGGELFDLISSGAGKNRKKAEDADDAETTMRKFFFELASGINYCHKNGIAHRDLKPENLLVHNTPGGQPTLKIADFGLSAAFGRSSKKEISDNDTTNDSLGSPMSQPSMDGESAFSPKSAMSPNSQASSNSVKDSMDKLIASGASALSFLTCGAMETVLCIPNGNSLVGGPSTLRRMTSVVGSPHYVAPEIISQNDEKEKRDKSQAGYDGAKADVWSAGVILYAMLFRSLPFGEDLLRCPRFQSYRKWYDEVRELGGRRSSSSAALNPSISGADEREFLGPHWFFPAATSKESRDLIVAMLNPLPEDRLSVAQVLEHPWIKAIAGEC